MSTLRQLLRPRRFQLRKVALCLAALGTAAEAQPRRVNAHTADGGRFANLLRADRFWSRRDIALDLRVQRASDGEDSTASTTEGNPFVQRKDLSKRLCRDKADEAKISEMKRNPYATNE
jgi:hypothetical protein